MSSQLPEIVADRIRLRTINKSDLDQVFAIFSDPKVMRYWSTPPLESVDDVRALMKEIKTGNEEGSMLKWGVALKINRCRDRHCHALPSRTHAGSRRSRLRTSAGLLGSWLHSRGIAGVADVRIRRNEAATN
jgi:RimJ/RimL family protein N-acetyltransferase